MIRKILINVMILSVLLMTGCKKSVDIESDYETHPAWKLYTEYPISYSVNEPVALSIQIDDTFYISSVSVELIMKLLSESAEKYTYEYNSEKLVQAMDSQIIDVYKKEKLYFQIYAVNLTEETTSLKNITVINIKPTETALPNVKILDGQSVLKMTYTDVKGLENSLFANFSVNESTQKEFGMSHIKLTYYGPNAKYLIEDINNNLDLKSEILYKINTEDTHVLSSQCTIHSIQYQFLINPDTGLVEKYWTEIAIRNFKKENDCWYNKNSLYIGF